MIESRRERYLKALEIAERNCNRFMAAKIRADRLPPPYQQMEPTTTPERFND